MGLVVLNRVGVLQPAAGTTDDQWHGAEIASALAKLSQAGFTLVVASNEPAISQGQMDLDELEALHARLSEQVENRGGAISAFFYCPHAPADACHCHKPKTGLIDAIELEFAVPANSMLLVTDNRDDLTLAEQTGAEALLVLTGLGRETRASLGDNTSTECFESLTDASNYILRHY